MKYHQSNIKIDRYIRDHIKICRGTSPVFLNGDVIVGNTVPSGISFDDPAIKGIKISINTKTLDLTFTEKFDIVFDNFVHKDEGQKVLVPFFEPGGRCFIRGRSSGSQAPGQDTVQNGIIEIDPDTGAKIGSVYSPGGGAFTELAECNKDQEIYFLEGNEDYVRVIDLDYNQIRRYYVGFENFGNLPFGVNANKDIVMVGGNVQVMKWYDLNQENTFSIDIDDIPTATGTQLVDARMSNSRIFLMDNDDTLSCYNLDAGDWEWAQNYSNYSCLTIGFDGSLYMGYGGTKQYMRKINPEDGSILYTSGVITDSLGTSPRLDTIGQLSIDFLYAWAGTLGVLRLLKDTGESLIVLDGSVGGGRGNLGIHPFQNDRIQNYSV